MLEPGAELGPFRIVEPIGKGGMASVYRAYEPALDRHVALKVLPQEFLHDPTFSERFKREAKVIARLEHRHIVPIHAFGIDDGTPWMAMRLFSSTLSSHLAKRLLPTREAVRILAEAAEALDYAHSKGILHRDVKPQNILLDEEAHVYLADFGIAKMLESTVALTQTGVVTGTPQYMSPEQARAEGVDHRTDIYALGIIAYEMFAGNVPFQADTPVAVLMKHVMDPIPRPDVQKVPDIVMTPVLKALAKQKVHRWDTAESFVAELGARVDEAGTYADGETREIAVPYDEVPTRALSSPIRPRAGVSPPPPRRSAVPPAPPEPKAKQPSMAARLVPGLFLAAVVFGLLLAAASVGYFASKRKAAREADDPVDRAALTIPLSAAGGASPGESAPTTTTTPPIPATTAPTARPKARSTPKPARRTTPRPTPPPTPVQTPTPTPPANAGADPGARGRIDATAHATADSAADSRSFRSRLPPAFVRKVRGHVAPKGAVGRAEKALQQRTLLRLFGLPDLRGEGRVDGDARLREPRFRPDEILGWEEVPRRPRQASRKTDRLDRPRHRRGPEDRPRLLLLAGLFHVQLD